MQKLTLREILLKYEAGQCTEEEKAVVETFYLQLPETGENMLSDQELMAAVDRISARLPIQSTPVRAIRLWPRIAAAAMLLLSIGIGSYFLIKEKFQDDQIAENHKLIIPGRNQATLTLANGQKIILTRGLSGQLAQQGATAISLNKQKVVSYSTPITENDKPMIYNTLSTSVGQQSPYPLELSDGTRVWLNALSSITFPVAFNSKSRLVKITGEAYFEVAHDEGRPFSVSVNDQIIEDIGTHFDVNAYNDEPFIQTVLLEGKIKVSQGNQTIYLAPGREVINQNGELKIQDADTEESVAWKNGYFSFNNTDIRTIMRVISRWYNIEVSYSINVTTDGFNGKISRFKDISKVLNMLSATGLVHFKVEGRRIIVLK
jgi:transmembrane sensor